MGSDSRACRAPVARCVQERRSCRTPFLAALMEREFCILLAQSVRSRVEVRSERQRGILARNLRFVKLHPRRSAFARAVKALARTICDPAANQHRAKRALVVALRLL